MQRSKERKKEDVNKNPPTASEEENEDGESALSATTDFNLEDLETVRNEQSETMKAKRMTNKTKF